MLKNSIPKKLSLCKEDIFREDIHAVSATVRTGKKNMSNALSYVKPIAYPKKVQTVFVTATIFSSQRGDGNTFAEHIACLWKTIIPLTT